MRQAMLSWGLAPHGEDPCPLHPSISLPLETRPGTAPADAPASPPPCLPRAHMPPPGDRREEGQLLAMEVILSLRCGVKRAAQPQSCLFFASLGHARA